MQEFLLCSLTSMAAGILIAVCYMFRSRYSKNLVAALVLLPVIVQTVIMMVNGNLGTGVAVLGAFSLIRFRSVPGTAREITAIFMAMAAGIAAGMGQLLFALAASVIIGGVMVVLTAADFGGRYSKGMELKITIPEDLEYTGVFDDIFKKYTLRAELKNVRTTNMGSLFELRYSILLRNPSEERAMINDLRCRNGNLGISCGMAADSTEAL